MDTIGMEKDVNLHLLLHPYAGPIGIKFPLLTLYYQQAKNPLCSCQQTKNVLIFNKRNNLLDQKVIVYVHI